MPTVIRAELSDRNKYKIPKQRYYELKHFCMQYPNWKKEYYAIGELSVMSFQLQPYTKTNGVSDPTGRAALLKAYYKQKMDMVEQAAEEADDYLKEYIIKAVTEELSFTYLKTKLDIPCSRDVYYNRYRKFFWILDKKRD